MKKVPNKQPWIENFMQSLKNLIDKSKWVINHWIKQIFEESSNNFDPKRREAIKKVAVITGWMLAGAVTYKLFTWDKDNWKEGDTWTENGEKVENEIWEFCKLKNLKKAWGEKQKDYELKYYDPNKVDNTWAMDRRSEQKKVLKWFRSMLIETCEHDWKTKTHLQMILDLADEYDVPAEILFLALNESGWQKRAWSGVWAKWYRQFMPQTLIDLWWSPEDALDPVKSTEFTMILYKQNFKRVKKYMKDIFGKTGSQDSNYKYGLAHHNCSPKMIRRWIKNGWSNLGFDNHYDAIWDYPSQHNGGHENARYVPRLLAIRNALKRLNEEWKLDVDATVKKIDKIVEEDDRNSTQADKMFENFLENAWTKNSNQLIKELQKILSEYEKEQLGWKITEKYFEWAKNVINEKIDAINADSNKEVEDEEIDNEDIGIVELNKSKDGRFQIYSYQIKDHANRWILLNKFRNEVDQSATDSKFFITDMAGNSFENDKKFKKWENVFIRYRLEDSFKRVNSWVYKIEIKKYATPQLIKKKFLQEFAQKNLKENVVKICDEKGKPYPNNQKFVAWNNVYIKIIRK